MNKERVVCNSLLNNQVRNSSRTFLTIMCLFIIIKFSPIGTQSLKRVTQIWNFQLKLRTDKNDSPPPLPCSDCSEKSSYGTLLRFGFCKQCCSLTRIFRAQFPQRMDGNQGDIRRAEREAFLREISVSYTKYFINITEIYDLKSQSNCTC